MDTRKSVQRILKQRIRRHCSQIRLLLPDLSLVLSIFIARNLGAVVFGKYTFALAFTALFAVFSDLGYNTLLIREVAIDKTHINTWITFYHTCINIPHIFRFNCNN